MKALILPGIMGLIFAAHAGAAGYDAPKPGEPHPDFVLPRIDDRAPVKLSSFRGKKVLLIQFASW